MAKKPGQINQFNCSFMDQTEMFETCAKRFYYLPPAIKVVDIKSLKILVGQKGSMNKSQGKNKGKRLPKQNNR